MAATMAGLFASTMIRCSSCNTEIDLARASEHVCPVPITTPNPGLSVFDRLNSPTPSMSSLRNAPLPGKLPKFAPSRIDPFAANETFLSPQSGAGSYPDSTLSSPVRTGSPASTRFRMPPRSATTPHFRERSRSPDMLMSQDSAFPLFPTRRVREKEAKKGNQRSKSMSRSQSRDRNAWQSNINSTGTSASRSASPAFSQFPPRPSTAGTTSRKNSISSVRSRNDQAALGSPAEPVPPLPMQHDANGRSSPRLDSNAGFLYEHISQATSPLAGPPLNPQASQELGFQQNALPERPELNRLNNSSLAIKPLDAIGSIKKPSHEYVPAMQRSQSAGGRGGDTAKAEMVPPISESMSVTVSNSPHDWISDPAVPASLAIRKPPPVPEMQRGEASTEDSLGKLPSFRSPEHVATDSPGKQRISASSDGSSYSRSHSISSQSSPPTSASSFTLHDIALKDEASEQVAGESGDKYKHSQIQDLAGSSISPSIPPPSTTGQRQRGPAKSFSRPNYARPHLDLSGPITTVPAQPSPRYGPPPQTLPNIMPKELHPASPSTEPRSTPPDTNSPNTELRTPPSFSPSGVPDRSFPPMSLKTAQAVGMPKTGDAIVNSPRRPNTPGMKGNCRGCGEVIVGKSVSSADGRLQGRYHKKCFVCQTCKEPFQTVDFYVINNQPYCQRHYHTLNGSMCGNCDRGIEGPYMETDAKRKFHPHCFTCKECHLILRSDYFEVNGVIYCEKHSRKPDLLGPGRRYPERRTTRLMMM